jgi:phosphotransferase system enzyme I (PtsI)
MTYSFEGIPINGGRVLAQVCLLSRDEHVDIPDIGVPTASIDEEIARLDATIEACAAELEAAAEQVKEKISAAEAEIFLAQKHILLDPPIVEEMREWIRDKNKTAERAAHIVFRGWEQRLGEIDNEVVRERVSDLKDIRRRLLASLRSTSLLVQCEGELSCTHGRGRVVVSHEVTPGMIVAIDFEQVAGFVTEHGGPTSHASILARSLGIPAVSGIHGLWDMVRCGDEILVDGEAGVVYLRPDRSLVQRLNPRRPGQVLPEFVEPPHQTPPGLQVLANVGVDLEVDLACKLGADGIGLFRTEYSFIQAGRPLSEQEQFDLYSRVVHKMAGRPVTFRLLDIGADKPVPGLDLEAEANPYLGLRGSRLLLARPELLTNQVRSLVRASRSGPIKVLYPMVIDASQLERLHGEVRRIVAAAGEEKNIEYGVMFEVPSACLQAAEILSQVDFGSIGSNDLIQYLFAVDRGNEHVHSDYDPRHPIFWNLLESLGREAAKAGKPLSVCGEIAGQEDMVPWLLAAGVTSFSVSPPLIPKIRHTLWRLREAEATISSAKGERSSSAET